MPAPPWAASGTCWAGGLPCPGRVGLQGAGRPCLASAFAPPCCPAAGEAGWPSGLSRLCSASVCPPGHVAYLLSAAGLACRGSRVGGVMREGAPGLALPSDLARQGSFGAALRERRMEVRRGGRGSCRGGRHPWHIQRQHAHCSANTLGSSCLHGSAASVTLLLGPPAAQAAPEAGGPRQPRSLAPAPSDVGELGGSTPADLRARVLTGLQRYFHQKRLAGLLSTRGLRVLHYACEKAHEGLEHSPAAPLQLWELVEQEIRCVCLGGDLHCALCVERGSGVGCSAAAGQLAGCVGTSLAPWRSLPKSAAARWRSRCLGPSSPTLSVCTFGPHCGLVCPPCSPSLLTRACAQLLAWLLRGFKGAPRPVRAAFRGVVANITGGRAGGRERRGECVSACACAHAYVCAHPMDACAMTLFLCNRGCVAPCGAHGLLMT